MKDLFGEQGNCVVQRSALVEDGHRYWLLRIWDHSRPFVTFVSLNPSTADGMQDDATTRRVMGFARAWGYGGCRLINLYSFQATRPEDLWRAAVPVGPGFWATFECRVRDSDVVAAWGSVVAPPSWAPEFSAHLRRALVTILRDSQRLDALGFCQNGQPRHPLYVRADAARVPAADHLRQLWKL